MMMMIIVLVVVIVVIFECLFSVGRLLRTRIASGQRAARIFRTVKVFAIVYLPGTIIVTVLTDCARFSRQATICVVVVVGCFLGRELIVE